jgi:hypothetical protein
MIATEHDERRATLQAELKKAESEIDNTLTRDAREFGSPFELRDKLNKARATREWAARKLADLEAEQVN